MRRHGGLLSTTEGRRPKVRENLDKFLPQDDEENAMENVGIPRDVNKDRPTASAMHRDEQRSIGEPLSVNVENNSKEYIEDTLAILNIDGTQKTNSELVSLINVVRERLTTYKDKYMD